MSVETYIGWRYLKAKRKQAFISLITVISLLGVALGVAAMIVVIAVMSGFENDLKTKILGVNSHIVVLADGRSLDNWRELLPQIAAVDGVASAEPFVYSQVMLSALGGVSGAVLRGVDVDLTRAGGGHLVKSATDGGLDLLKDDPGPPLRPSTQVLVGQELARQMGILAGDEVKIISPLGQVTPLGGRAPRTREFTVSGLFQSGLYEYDSNLMYVSLAQAQDFLNLGRSVTGVEIKVKDLYQAGRIKEEILSALGPGYKARDWMEMNKNLFSALKLEKVAMFIILTLTVLVAAFNVVSTLVMVVMEKTREIAILMSMGAARRTILRIFVFQGLLIGLIGTGAGLVGGLVLCRLLARYKFLQLPADVYYTTVLPVRLEGLDVALITLSAVVISLLATIYPAWQASRLNPVEALRYE